MEVDTAELFASVRQLANKRNPATSAENGTERPAFSGMRLSLIRNMIVNSGLIVAVFTR